MSLLAALGMFLYTQKGAIDGSLAVYEFYRPPAFLVSCRVIRDRVRSGPAVTIWTWGGTSLAGVGWPPCQPGSCLPLN